MKNYKSILSVACFTLLLITQQANAQLFTKEPGVFETFKLYGGMSAPLPVSVYVEPQISLTDAMQIGYRYQYFLSESPKYGGSQTDGIKRSANLITFEYIRGVRSFRPFVNIGLGAVTSQYLPNRDEDKITDTHSSVLFIPKVGFNVGAFRFGISYNFAQRSKYDPANTYGPNMELAIRLWGRQKTILVY
jgi:hypothetical protein